MRMTHQRRRSQGFSLIEILVAVALLAVIMLGLLAMFYQTQRAFRLGSTQVDVAEAGRATMQVLSSELKQLVPSPEAPIPGLYTDNTYNNFVIFPRPFVDDPLRATLKELFFVTRENDQWMARGYFVEAVTPLGGAGTLYQFSTNISVSVSNAFEQAFRQFKIAKGETQPRVTDRVVHLNLYAYDAYGYPWLGNGPGTNRNELDFRTNQLPAFVELELGLIEPKIYERFRARYDNTPANAPVAIQYLTNRVDQVYLFRQRIPIRTVHETLF